MRRKKPKPNPLDIDLTFSTHIGAAVGVAIDNILQRIKNKQQTVEIPITYYPLIEELKNGELIQSNASFREILEKISQKGMRSLTKKEKELLEQHSRSVR